MNFASIDMALEELSNGHMVILIDDEKREHEGDLVIAAEKITPESINFMITHARGMLCLTVAEQIVQRLEIPLMPTRNNHPHQATFTVSIEAASGVTSGMSTRDRAHTILTAVNPKSGPQDISMPGHIFPLVSRNGGVLERPGHTEGSVDLVKLAGLQPAAVICEIIKSNGDMARLPDLVEFSAKHEIQLVAINDLIAYRLTHSPTI